LIHQIDASEHLHMKVDEDAFIFVNNNVFLMFLYFYLNKKPCFLKYHTVDTRIVDIDKKYLLTIWVYDSAYNVLALVKILVRLSYAETTPRFVQNTGTKVLFEFPLPYEASI
ncbi:hypothetical protein ACJX0J_035097, partial [Zea mays]